MPRPLNVEERMVNRELKQLRSERDELRDRIDQLLDALKSAPNPDKYKMGSPFMDAYKWWRLNIFEIIVNAENKR